MSRFDKQLAITPEKVGHNLGHKVAAVLPEDREVVVPAVNRGIPFMMGEGKTKEIGKSILELVGKIREKLSKLEEVPADEN
jgi:septum formation inhibitor-activating ATPase MinD